ncbi:MAG: L-rhamnose mutarotase [Ignavibacteriaceae bacterium]
MKKHFIFGVILGSLLLLNSCAQEGQKDISGIKQVTKRIGMVIGIKADKIDEYKKLHTDSNAGVRDLLNKYNMHNFSIFLKQFDDGKWFLFGYYEYTGSDYEADMSKLAEENRNIEWLKMTDPMQIPFEGESSWSQMEQVYYNK